MPAIRRTVFNPEGEQYVPDAERIGIQQNQFNAAHQAQLEALRNQMALAQMASNDRGLDRASHEKLTGSYDERANDQFGLQAMNNESAFNLAKMAEGGATERAKVANEPAMGALALRGKEWDAGAKGREVGDARSGLQLGAMQALQGYMTPGDGAAGGNGDDRLALLAAIANGGQIPDMAKRSTERQVLQMQLEAMKKERALADAQRFADAGDNAKADEIAGAAGTALARPKFGNADTSLADLLKSAGEFGAKDAAMVGWDPTESDMASLDTQANQAIALLERDYRMPHEQALQIVNQKIQQELAKRKGVNTGMIDQFLAKRGLK